MSSVGEGIRKVQETLQGLYPHDKKLADLAKDTTDIHTAGSITTDHGTKVENTDEWLKASDSSKSGPSMLEDQIAREKVRFTLPSSVDP